MDCAFLIPDSTCILHGDFSSQSLYKRGLGAPTNPSQWFTFPAWPSAPAGCCIPQRRRPRGVERSEADPQHLHKLKASCSGKLFAMLPPSLWHHHWFLLMGKTPCSHAQRRICATGSVGLSWGPQPGGLFGSGEDTDEVGAASRRWWSVAHVALALSRVA